MFHLGQLFLVETDPVRKQTVKYAHSLELWIFSLFGPQQVIDSIPQLTVRQMMCFLKDILKHQGLLVLSIWNFLNESGEEQVGLYWTAIVGLLNLVSKAFIVLFYELHSYQT